METTPTYGTDASGNTVQTGWAYTDGSGVVQYYDMQNQLIGSSYAGGESYSELPQSAPDGYGIVFSGNEPILDQDGNYVLAPIPEGADTFQYEVAGHPAYDAGVYPAFAPSAPAPQTSTAAPSSADTGGHSWTSGRGSYARGGYGSSGYSSGGQGYYTGGNTPSQSYSSTPTYADGRVHPWFGGQPLVPGGRWNTESGGGGGGWNNVPPLPYSPTSSSGSGYGGSSGGGGGGGSALYQAWRNKLEAKMYPGSGSGYGAQSASSKYPNYDPPENRMQGRWARQVHPDQAASISYRPTMMIPRVAPSLNSSSPLYQDVAQMPASQLSLIGSSRQRVNPGSSGWLTYGANGKEQTVGARPSTLYSSQINSLGNFYDDVINKEGFPTFDSISKSLTQTRPNSALGLMMKNQPAAYQASTYSSMLGAALSETLDPRSAGTYAEAGSALLDQYGAKYMRRNPKNTPMPTKYVGRRLF